VQKERKKRKKWQLAAAKAKEIRRALQFLHFPTELLQFLGCLAAQLALPFKPTASL